MRNNISLSFSTFIYGYSNFLSLSWKIGDTLITVTFVTSADDISTVVHDRAIIDLGLRRRGSGDVGYSRRTQSETRQAVKSRPVAQKPPCAQAAARCKQHTRHGSTCTLPRTIIISKLYNELGHSTRSSVASLCRDRRCSDIDVDILLCRKRQTINGRSCKLSLSLSLSSLSFSLTFANAQIVGSICGFHDVRISVYFRMTRTDFITNYFGSLLFYDFNAVSIIIFD